MDKCFFCKGDKVNSFTTHTVDIGNRCIVIRHVPCDECVQCGEITLGGDVMMELEAIVDEFRSASRAEVAIMSYSNEKAA